jgi:chromosome segregation ATPase
MFGLGGFVVCSTADIAKRIAFNPNRNLRVKCVTLDGDIIDPAGTLTGGFYSSNTLVLSRYDEVRRLEERLVEQKNQLSRARQDYDTYKRHLRDYQNSRT